MATNLFQTGDGAGVTRAFCLLPLADVDWFKRQLIKALTLMCEPENWIVQGDQTIEYALDQANIMMRDLIMFTFNPFPPGTVQAYAGAALPDGWLECDGAAYEQSDYPELYAALGDTWGAAGTTFNVPDLRNRTIIGVSAGYTLAETGGEERHTLSEAEMPVHSHSYSKPEIPTLVFEPGEVPVSTIDLFPDNTGTAGGGESHNNMQPFGTAYWIIYAAR